jgi:hypothetical protein
MGSAWALLFSQQHLKLNKLLVLLSQHQSDANLATHIIPIVCIADLASHDAAIATQVTVFIQLQMLLRE